MIPDEAFERGLALRCKMFGRAEAQRQIDTATAFTRPLQEWVTRACFGELWQRPDLDLRIRSMLTVAVLAALGRPNQIKLHVKGALANGVTPEEIREVLLHVMAYAGLPAAADGFAAAAEALTDTGRA